MDEPRLMVGCMTGTSLDGLDAALVRVAGAGLSLSAELVSHHAVALPEALADALRPMMRGRAVTPLHVLRAARHLGATHAQAVAELLERADTSAEDVEAVVCHGQTVWHAPDDRLSWQLFDPWPLVRTLGVPVCYDLRQADLVAGGQGAPITPAADEVLFGRGDGDVLVVNLGGICNTTWLGGDTRGEDIGPCNLLIDGFVQRLTDAVFDEGGTLTGEGEADPELLGAMRAHPWFTKPKPRTAGREDFDADWIDGLLAEHKVSAADACATAAAFVAELIATAHQSCGSETKHVVLAGGGARNPALVARITQAIGGAAAVQTSDELGVPVQAREAMAMAVLGAMSQDGTPITLPQITGADQPGCAGVWAYP